MKSLNIDLEWLRFDQACKFVFRREDFTEVTISEACLKNAAEGHHALIKIMEQRLPIYGVTTGFGDSCFRVIEPQQSETLQSNLISYLLCGSGPLLPVEASRALFLIRLKSLSRGYSAVSPELLERMRMYLANDWIPAVPREGSLGASGDLIPLAYLAQCLRGEGNLLIDGKTVPTAEVLKSAGVEPYAFKPKEGLALVNGTSAMAGLGTYNLVAAKYLLQVSALATAWLCQCLNGRTEPFEELVNMKGNQHRGQREIAARIKKYLSDESYQSAPLDTIKIQDSRTIGQVQDRYSLRCAPQILGPVAETVEQVEKWIEEEINGTSDNPLIEKDGALGMGGNFYGGYLSQGMDYLKISLAHVADMTDRQLAMLIDEKSNRGLPANLAAWPDLPESERHLHHGLKGLHQSVSAITSEIMSKAMPNGIFSRSTESHNQDKVSLGMSAAVQCMQMLEQMFTVSALNLICLAQAIDLRKITLRGRESLRLYETVRKATPFVKHDQPLDQALLNLTAALRQQAYKQAGASSEKN